MAKKLKRGFRKARYIVYRETSHNPTDNMWGFFGSLLGISTIGLLQELYFRGSDDDILFLIGAFGATSVLLFGATNSPLAQPRNLIFGSIISAIVGVTVYQLLFVEAYPWLSPAVAVASAILAMQYTKTLHPPGGAIALIANIGSSEIKSMGYYYVVNPVMTGVVILFVLAVLFNNLSRNRIYPYQNIKPRGTSYWRKIQFWNVRVWKKE
ncbi:HPP family protein [Pleomorphovibrio marinus]|uniref:HPP family protein n=1 Tax=Pleomorphovibrio marinus TaxID=2164132 RepID=UPI000E0B1339|nr:HPP family protein [Pleomorphovibrio marinus]